MTRAEQREKKIRRDAEIVALYESGKTRKEISDIMGLSKAIVKNAIAGALPTCTNPKHFTSGWAAVWSAEWDATCAKFRRIEWQK